MDEKGRAINGAKVHAVWSLPNGSSVDQYRKTRNQSKASFGLVADIPGDYKQTMTEVTMPSYSFDVDNSNVLTGQIDIAP